MGFLLKYCTTPLTHSPAHTRPSRLALAHAPRLRSTTLHIYHSTVHILSIYTQYTVLVLSICCRGTVYSILANREFKRPATRAPNFHCVTIFLNTDVCGIWGRMDGATYHLPP